MEWNDFQNRAIADVSEGYLSKAPTDHRLLQVLIIPPQDPVSSTELFIKQPESYFVAQKIWHRVHDIAKYQTSSSAFKRLRFTVPTIETHVARLNKNRAEELLDLFRTLHIPLLMRDEPAENDSTHYQVTLETHSTCVHFQWKSAPIQPWSQLNQAADHFVSVVKELVEQKS